MNRCYVTRGACKPCWARIRTYLGVTFLLCWIALYTPLSVVVAMFVFHLHKLDPHIYVDLFGVKLQTKNAVNVLMCLGVQGEKYIYVRHVM